jgi:hypothetical protein
LRVPSSLFDLIAKRETARHDRFRAGKLSLKMLGARRPHAAEQLSVTFILRSPGIVQI